MSGAPIMQPNNYGPYRRKVTFACDSCRKKRSKCSGTLPCACCVESETECTFNDKNRVRRGPRPRAPANQLPKVTRQLAPAPLRTTPTTISTSSSITAVARREPEVAPVSSRVFVSEPVAIHQEEEEEEEASSQDEDRDDDDLPHMVEWRPGLETVLSRHGERGDVDNVDLVCHLIELFCVRMSASLRIAIPPVDFIGLIRSGTCPASLIYAVCACSVRFSVHRVAREALAAKGDKQFERAAREQLRLTDAPGREACQVQTYCVLVEYALSNGNGKRAWIDIAIARSMLQVVTARAAAPSLSERQSLENAQKYLAIAEAYHCISHTLLPSSYQDNRKLCVTSWKTNNRESPHENELENQLDLASTQQFLDLLHVLVRIKQLCSTPFLQQEPPPWSLDSAFCAVQIELESILVRRVETIRMSAFNSHPHDESTMVEQTMKTERSTLCALLWHCCVIILNRTYLPIPERRTPGGDDHGGTAPEEVHCVDFPSAPYLFVQERIHRCESSASAVFGLCRDLVTTSGAFFQNTLLVGFTCFQSALVLVNQLHRGLQVHDPTIVDKLKFHFVVLGLVRKFYPPAQDWLDVLFRVHDINTPLRSASADPKAAFADYFARFVDLDEPSLVPLDSQEYVRGHATAAAAQRGATANKTHRSTTAQANSGADQEQPLWIQSYSGYLYEDMHSDDGTDVAVRDRKPKKFNEPNESEEPRLDAIICSPARDKPPALQDSSGYRVDEKSLHVPGSILTSMPVNDMISYESRVRHHQGSMPRWDNAFFGSPGDMLSGAGFAPYGDVPSLYEFGEMMPDVLVELKANEDAWAEIMANMDGPLP